MARLRLPLRFSLRTVFLIVTLLGCWLGYHLNRIRERQEYLQSGLVDSRMYPGTSPQPMPFALRMFHEEPQGLIWLTHQNDAECARAERLFPEATVLNGKPVYGEPYYRYPSYGWGDSSDY